MTGKEIMESEDFKRCVQFHGHLCPGLSLGYRAAKAALAKLAESRAEDEEVVAAVETDACFVDAVQVLTGCTFGKGNFIYKGYGKMALTLLSRKSGRGVRISMRNGVFDPGDEHPMLLKKIMQNEADENEWQRFNQLRQTRTSNILEMNETLLFKIEEIDTPLPPTARMAPSQPCDECRKPTMETKLVHSNGRNLCRACLRQG
jgi:formylmethanofuran dehydrogenase subunit E